MLDSNYLNDILNKVEEASYRGALRAHKENSNSPVNEKEWITAIEAARDYETSRSSLLTMRNELDIRKDTEWKMLRGKVVYLRTALERECVRRAK